MKTKITSGLCTLFCGCWWCLQSYFMAFSILLILLFSGVKLVYHVKYFKTYNEFIGYMNRMDLDPKDVIKIVDIEKDCIILIYYW